MIIIVREWRPYLEGPISLANATLHNYDRNILEGEIILTKIIYFTQSPFKSIYFKSTHPTPLEIQWWPPNNQSCTSLRDLRSECRPINPLTAKYSI